MTHRNTLRREYGFLKPFHGLAPVVGLMALISCLLVLTPSRSLASSATVFVEGVPGGVIMNTVEVSAKVIAIDQDARIATLQDTEGKTFTAKAGPGAVNFDQVNMGDMVRITMTEELVVSLDEEGATPVDSGVAAVATAPKGAQPAGLVAKTRQVTGTVSSIDLGTHTVVLEFKDGRSGTFPVRPDVDLTQRKVGDQVVFRLTEKLMISVQKP